jgi:hypothetical protein
MHPKFIENPLASLIERELERMNPEPKNMGHYERVKSTHSSFSSRRSLQEDDTAASFDDSDEEP